MKAIMKSVLGLALCGITPLAADNCCNWNNNCCEWSMCDGRFTVGADWLYWKTQSDFEIGDVFTFAESRDDPYTQFTKCTPKRFDFQYDNGFRVYAGYELPCDCWDVGVSYVYLPSTSKKSSFKSEEPLADFSDVFAARLTDLQQISFDLSDNDFLFDEYAAKWDSNIQWIDVDLGRTVCLGECFKLRPHAGFRAAWMDQKYRTFGLITEGENENTFFVDSIKQKFNGYGIQGGIWGDWEISCGLSFVGHFGGSLLASKYKITEDSLISVQGDPGTFYPGSCSDSFWTATPTVDYFFGLRYADCFCDMVFSAHVGWEQHLFFNLNRLDSHCNGNLSTQGLTLGLDVSF